MGRSTVIDWLRYGTVTGLVFSSGAAVSGIHFGADWLDVGLLAAGGFAFGATIEWISLKFRTPATAFAVILTLAFVGTLEAYAPEPEAVGIREDFRSLSAVLTDPDTAGEGALSRASVQRNVDSIATQAAARRQAEEEAAAQAEAVRAPFEVLKRRGRSRTGGAGSP